MEQLIIAFFVVWQKNTVLVERRGQYIGIPGIELQGEEHPCEAGERALKKISFPAPFIPVKSRKYKHLGCKTNCFWNNTPAVFDFYEVQWEVYAPTHIDAKFIDPTEQDPSFDITISMLKEILVGPRQLEAVA